MATDVSPVYVRQYEGNLRQLAQQTTSKLRSWIMERHSTSMHLWDRIGVLSHTTGIQTKTRAMNTPDNDIVLDRRRTTPTAFNTSTLVDRSDVAQALVNPNSAILHAQAMAFGRKIDDTILTAALGNSVAEDGTTTALPAGQILGGATQAFDFAFITTVAEKFMLNDIPLEEEKVFIVRPNGAKKLLALTQATSSDYVNAKALATTGFVEKWMGFTWIVSTLLPNVTGLQYNYVAMTRRAIGLHFSQDIMTRVAEDPTKSFSWRVYSEAAFGAGRIEDSHVVRAHVLES